MNRFVRFLTAALIACAAFAVVVGCGGKDNTAAHTMTYHEAVAATCTEDGNIAYYSCSECNKNFEDEAGEREITGSVVIPATGHDMTYFSAQDATCTDNGHTAYYVCENCGKYFSDEEGETEITAENTVISATGHTYKTPVWSWTEYSSATVKFECEKGDGEQEITAVITSKVTQAASCTQDGLRTYTATAAFGGKTYEDTKTEVISATGHDMTYVPSQDATCTEAGNIEYYYCADCGEYYSDAEGKTEITQAETVLAIDPTAHTWSEKWSADDEAHWHECVNCGEKKDNEEHSFAPATTEAPETCTVCGQTRGEKLFFASSNAEFSLEQNPNGNWTYGTVVYAWDNSQAIKNGGESFTFTAATEKSGDSWIADNVEIKAGWINSGATAAIAYTFENGGTYTFHMQMNGSQENTRFIIRYAIVGKDQTEARQGVFFSGTEQREWNFDHQIDVQEGDTIYIMFFNETKVEGSYPQADYLITFTEVRGQETQGEEETQA